MLKIENATIKYRGHEFFNGLNFEIRKNEHWAIVGESGSGKSALLKTLAGRYFLSGGKITRHYYERFKKEHMISDPLFSHQKLISYVDVRHDFKNRSNTGDFFYQQRFNAGYSDNAPTVEEFLKDRAEKTGSDHFTGKWTPDRVFRIFNLESLRHKHLIQLSNGETKRLRIGAALLKNPKLLLLDNPMAGLDVYSRTLIEDVFATIAGSGVGLIMVTSAFKIPKIITHVATLNNKRRLITFVRQAFSAEPGKKTDMILPVAKKMKTLMERKQNSKFDVLVSMKNARVAYGDSLIFDHINWQVRPGDRWSLSGPNGSGKSTLLSLINGDHPQAYANDIILFDKKRGTGESIWDIKKKIGFMSPELFQYFPHHFTCLQVVESGFYDTIGLLRPSHRPNREIAEQWMDVMGLSSIKENRLSEVPTSWQRLCLLARAMVKTPYLLLLDEPCLGFDCNQQQAFKVLIDEIAKISDLAIVYVTHQQETLPDCITKTMMLEVSGTDGEST